MSCYPGGPEYTGRLLSPEVVHLRTTAWLGPRARARLNAGATVIAGGWTAALWETKRDLTALLALARVLPRPLAVEIVAEWVPPPFEPGDVDEWVAVGEDDLAACEPYLWEAGNSAAPPIVDDLTACEPYLWEGGAVAAPPLVGHCVAVGEDDLAAREPREGGNSAGPPIADDRVAAPAPPLTTPPLGGSARTPAPAPPIVDDCHLRLLVRTGGTADVRAVRDLFLDAATTPSGSPSTPTARFRVVPTPESAARLGITWDPGDGTQLIAYSPEAPGEGPEARFDLACCQVRLIGGARFRAAAAPGALPAVAGRRTVHMCRHGPIVGRALKYEARGFWPKGGGCTIVAELERIANGVGARCPCVGLMGGARAASGDEGPEAARLIEIVARHAAGACPRLPPKGDGVPPKGDGVPPKGDGADAAAAPVDAAGARSCLDTVLVDETGAFAYGGGGRRAAPKCAGKS
jgi:hypothetical protein